MGNEKKRCLRFSHSKKEESEEKLAENRKTANKDTSPKKKIKKPNKKLPNCSDFKTEDDVDLKLSFNGVNYVNLIRNVERGFCKASTLQQIAESYFIQDLKWSKPFKVMEFNSRRLTAIQWHPFIPKLFVAGGKDGSLTLFSNFEDKLPDWEGVGPGGTIEQVQFCPKLSDCHVVTASVDGTLSLYDLELRKSTVLVDTQLAESHWFCTVHTHPDGKTVLGGDNKGYVTLHHMDNNKFENIKLHTSKIRHLELNPRDPNMLVTASLDKTVKLWDMRKLERKHFVECLNHTTSVASASFSSTDGCRLLTTDLHSELRVYRAPSWALEHKITHPHRHFQHLTIIRASWHPRADLFVVGRYPDPKLSDYDKDMRSVDVLSARTGKVCYELMETSRLITSLAQFNSTGSFLATTCGKTLYFWYSTRQNAGFL